MTINKNLDGQTLTLELEGRLDTITAPELEGVLNDSLEGVAALILDFKSLVYLSSAGLRVLLAAQKRMAKQGSMKVKNVNDTIMEVFTVTGFCDILDIE